MQGPTKRQMVEKVVRKLRVPPDEPEPATKKKRPSSAPSPAQRREQVGARLAVLLVASFVLIWVALGLTALVRTTSSAEMLDVAGRLLPILVALLTPILHHYFGRGRDGKDH